MAIDRPGAQQPDGGADAVRSHTCSRVGMRANPPGLRLSLPGWFRRD